MLYAGQAFSTPIIGRGRFYGVIIAIEVRVNSKFE